MNYVFRYGFQTVTFFVRFFACLNALYLHDNTKINKGVVKRFEFVWFACAAFATFLVPIKYGLFNRNSQKPDTFRKNQIIANN